jgi:hypothetical protein
MEMEQSANGLVAQSVEQRPFKPLVLGSSPSQPTSANLPPSGHPSGMPDSSRRSSAAIPPDHPKQNQPHAGGVPDPRSQTPNIGDRIFNWFFRRRFRLRMRGMRAVILGAAEM